MAKRRSGALARRGPNLAARTGAAYGYVGDNQADVDAFLASLAPPPPPPIDWDFINSLREPAPAPVSYAAYDGGGGGGVDYGGGGGGGFAMEAAPEPPPYNPWEDPSFVNLLNQLGLQESTARTQAATKSAQAEEERVQATPRIKEAGEVSRRNINLGWEGRGLYRSGARLRDLALQERGEQQRIGDVERGAARSKTAIQQNLDQQILDVANKRADAMFQARMRRGSDIPALNFG